MYLAIVIVIKQAKTIKDECRNTKINNINIMKFQDTYMATANVTKHAKQ